MNIGDYVYVYIYDLEKSIANMNQFREDRFGKITNIQELETQNKDNILVYDIVLRDSNIKYRTDNLVSNIISINDLIELIGRIDISSDKRRDLLEQLNRIVF